MRLVIATHNQNKLQEMQDKLPKHWHLVSLADLNSEDTLPEEGNTIEENAHQKARYIHNLTNLNVLADDTGLEIEALNNEPGPYAAFYAGPQKSDADNIAKVLNEMKDKTNRKAVFKTCMCLIIDGHTEYFIGETEGEITDSKKGLYGFGYDSIFQPKGSNKTYAEMFLDEKNNISHRAKALDMVINYLSLK